MNRTLLVRSLVILAVAAVLSGASLIVANNLSDPLPTATASTYVH